MNSLSEDAMSGHDPKWAGLAVGGHPKEHPETAAVVLDAALDAACELLGGPVEALVTQQLESPRGKEDWKRHLLSLGEAKTPPVGLE